jgi:hypothetical protein
MPRWLRMIRGTIGTGLAFSIGGGAVALALGVPMLVAGRIGVLDLIFVGARFGAVAFLLGVGFSAILAVTARGLSLEKLSLRRVTAIGAGLGLAWFALIARNGIDVWTPGIALLNLVSLTAMGGGSAAAILLLARRAGMSHRAPEEPHLLGEGAFEPLSTRPRAGEEAPVVARQAGRA